MYLSIWHNYDLLDLFHKEDSRVGLGEVDEVSLLEAKAVLGRYAAPVFAKAFQATVFAFCFEKGRTQYLHDLQLYSFEIDG